MENLLRFGRFFPHKEFMKISLQATINYERECKVNKQ